MEQITIIAHLGKDANVTVKEDHFLINMNVAVSQKYTKRDGEEVEKTNWYSVLKRFRNEPTEKFLKHLVKGAKVLIQGTPSYKIYNGDQGNSVSITVNCDQLMLLTFQE